LENLNTFNMSGGGGKRYCMSETEVKSSPKKRLGGPPRTLFKKGNQVAKGRGRPKKDSNITKLCKLHTAECVEGLINIVRDGRARNSDKINAINTILSYGHGKPRASVDVTSTYDVTGDFLAALKAVNARATDAKANDRAKLASPDAQDAEIVD